MKNNIIITGEIGINHNGSLKLAKDLMKMAKLAGCDFVKFQKRNPDICVPEKQKNVPKSTPWGEMTYLEYKKKTEFDEKEYKTLITDGLDFELAWLEFKRNMYSLRSNEENERISLMKKRIMN